MRVPNVLRGQSESQFAPLRTIDRRAKKTFQVETCVEPKSAERLISQVEKLSHLAEFLVAGVEQFAHRLIG